MDKAVIFIESLSNILRQLSSNRLGNDSAENSTAEKVSKVNGIGRAFSLNFV